MVGELGCADRTRPVLEALAGLAWQRQDGPGWDPARPLLEDL
jgi:hypothetical protein